MTAWKRLTALKSAPRELWLVFALKMLESFAYFSSSLNLSLYLTNEFGYSDLEAGVLYSAWGVTAGVIGMLMGPLIDRLGVRTSLLVGGTLLTLGRVLFAAATSKSQLYVALFLLQSLGMTLGIPVLSIAIRRVTTSQTQSTAYGLFYSAMNVAALVAGLSTDALRSALVHDDNNDTQVLRLLFWIGAGASALYTAIAAIWFRPVPVRPSYDSHPNMPDGDEEDGLVGTPAEPGWRRAWREIRETSRDTVFWRLVAFSGIIFGARTVFRHMDGTELLYTPHPNPVSITLTLTLCPSH